MRKLIVLVDVVIMPLVRKLFQVIFIIGILSGNDLGLSSYLDGAFFVFVEGVLLAIIG